MCPAARPNLSAVSAVTGSMFAVPRTPSVPKICLGSGLAAGLEVVWFMVGSDVRKTSAFRWHDYLDFFRRHAHMAHAGGCRNFDSLGQIARAFYPGEVYQHAQVFGLQVLEDARVATHGHIHCA